MVSWTGTVLCGCSFYIDIGVILEDKSFPKALPASNTYAIPLEAPYLMQRSGGLHGPNSVMKTDVSRLFWFESFALTSELTEYSKVSAIVLLFL